MRSYPNPISFRLDEQYSQRLSDEAEKHEQSAGEYARRVVLDSLEDAERQRLRDALHGLQQEVVRLRTEIEPIQREEIAARAEAKGLRAEVVALRVELGAVRVDLAKAVTALLVGAGRVDKDEAKTWVQNNLAK